MTQNDYVVVMQERLDWCVQTERYKMTTRLRDLIEYKTTGDKNVKNKYYMYLAKKYALDFYDIRTSF